MAAARASCGARWCCRRAAAQHNVGGEADGARQRTCPNDPAQRRRAAAPEVKGGAFAEGTQKGGSKEPRQQQKTSAEGIAHTPSKDDNASRMEQQQGARCRKQRNHARGALIRAPAMRGVTRRRSDVKPAQAIRWFDFPIPRCRATMIDCRERAMPREAARYARSADAAETPQRRDAISARRACAYEEGAERRLKPPVQGAAKRAAENAQRRETLRVPYTRQQRLMRARKARCSPFEQRPPPTPPATREGECRHAARPTRQPAQHARRRCSRHARARSTARPRTAAACATSDPIPDRSTPIADYNVC